MNGPMSQALVHERVIAQAHLTPEAVAVSSGAGSTTYQELVQRSKRLAGVLTRAGVTAESSVGVLADRSPETIVAFLGVLMAGGTYVPIAADSSPDRARMIAADANVTVLAGQVSGPLAKAIPARAVIAEACDARGDCASDDFRLPVVNAGSAAYVIFTSGSTGRPKGVVVSHGAVLSSTVARFGVYPHESMTYLVTAPLTIDAAVAGLYFSLVSGGRVVLPTDEEALDPEMLANLIVREAVTHVDGLPPQYAALLDFHPEALRDVRCVILGGEALPKRLASRHLQELPRAALFNEYGPTEATVWCTSHRCSKGDEGPLTPIGRPISQARVTVLTDDLRPVPPGTVGEIYIGGPGLARGYVGRPALTAARFIADPDPRHPGERVYRTGDLGHVTADGDLVFHGRTDQLVKVRGHRVETGEVEARLLAHPEVVEAVVVPSPTIAGTRLVAIVSVAPGGDVDSRTLSAFVADLLPNYMIPTVWRQVDTLPVTAIGKIDRPTITATATAIGVPLSR